MAEVSPRHSLTFREVRNVRLSRSQAAITAGKGAYTTFLNKQKFNSKDGITKVNYREQARAISELPYVSMKFDPTPLLGPTSVVSTSQ